MKVTFDASQIDALTARLQGLPDRAGRTVRTALTRTGQQVLKAEVKEMRDVFDRPTPYTLNGLFLRPATASEPEAIVGIKGDGARPAIKYLRWQIYGGNRTLKAFEKALVAGGAMRSSDRAVPGKFAKLDSFGNVSAGQIVQILSQLRIDTTVGSTRSLPRLTSGDRAVLRQTAAFKQRRLTGPVNRSDAKLAQAKVRRIKSAYTRAGGQFVAFPNGRGKLLPGVYQIRQFAAGRADPKPVLIFVPRASYEAERFDFFYTAQLAVERSLPQEIERAFDETLKVIVNPGAAR